jgi:hypothetical protein
MSSKATITKRDNSAVSTGAHVSQQSSLKTLPNAGAKKSYRASSVSRTLRVPNELVEKIQALITAYRTQQRNDPDSW